MKKVKFKAGLESHNPAIRGIRLTDLPKFDKDKFPERLSKKKEIRESE